MVAPRLLPAAEAKDNNQNAINARVGFKTSMIGFLNLDCGLAEGFSYIDDVTQLNYSSDAQFIETGTSQPISSDFVYKSIPKKFMYVRSFPSGRRNCYTFNPMQQGSKYLIRAYFKYGDYDGLNRPPRFDLHIGVNQWMTLDASTAEFEAEPEIIIAPLDNYISVCLINTGYGQPFISALELRPLPFSLYEFVNSTQALSLLDVRLDHGSLTNRLLRYPDDPYDRIWNASPNRTGWLPLSTDSQVISKSYDPFQLPSFVLQTAVTPSTSHKNGGFGTLDFSYSVMPGTKVYVFFHFAEIKLLGMNESRTFYCYLNGNGGGPFGVRYLIADHLIVTDDESLTNYNFSFRASRNSTLPPILNALEIYSLQRFRKLATNSTDADAITSIKSVYGIKRNWMGDPCGPIGFQWDGVLCSNGTLQSPRITDLNLSSGGLVGTISTSIKNLTAIQSLDLSNNNLTGKIPSFLEGLRSLQILNLSSNQLSGSIPPRLYERSLNGSLLLSSVENNPDLCYQKDSCVAKRNKIIIPISILASIIMVVLLVSIFIWRMKRIRPSVSNNSLMKQLKDGLQSEGRQFTSSEIVDITNNFAQAIGRGGFGSVYGGCLENGTQVAVKVLSQVSTQGAKEFQNEVSLLMRVHHRNLVTLLGYCCESDMLALVYEFMAQGNVAQHLSAQNSDVLSWRARLQIAVEAAQGLEYLHKGCKPPIIHRDVKAANILLNHDFKAKIADFGLSRIFANENDTHISTRVAGTPGYLDPEYQSTGILNEKSDVYSFGVVLLELITGQPAVITNPTETINIIRWVQSRLQRGNIDSVVDHRLDGRYNTSFFWKTVEIAMACTTPAMARRPTMSDVLLQLKGCLAPNIDLNASGGLSTGNLELVPLQLNSDMSPSTR